MKRTFCDLCTEPLDRAKPLGFGSLPMLGTVGEVVDIGLSVSLKARRGDIRVAHPEDADLCSECVAAVLEVAAEVLRENQVVPPFVERTLEIPPCAAADGRPGRVVFRHETVGPNSRHLSCLRVLEDGPLRDAHFGPVLLRRRQDHFGHSDCNSEHFR